MKNASIKCKKCGHEILSCSEELEMTLDSSLACENCGESVIRAKDATIKITKDGGILISGGKGGTFIDRMVIRGKDV